MQDDAVLTAEDGPACRMGEEARGGDTAGGNEAAGRSSGHVVVVVQDAEHRRAPPVVERAEPTAELGIRDDVVPPLADQGGAGVEEWWLRR